MRHFFGKNDEGAVTEIVPETNTNILPDTIPGLLKMLYYIIPSIFCKTAMRTPILDRKTEAMPG